MSRYYWLAVSADKYELPLAVADTAEELGRIFGLGKNAICDSVLKGNNGKRSGRKFVKVEKKESGQ